MADAYRTYRATCRCGWQTDARSTEEDARRDLMHHLPAVIHEGKIEVMLYPRTEDGGDDGTAEKGD